jgi:guanylate kinase
MNPSRSKVSPFAASPVPIVLVLSGPSGAGKDAALNVMKARPLPLAFIVTNTTRQQRPGEVDNVHYHFISQEEFARLIERGEFLEYAEVYGHFYGVPKAPVREALAQGMDVIIKVDVQGAMTIKKNLPGTVLVFLMPPSREDLEQRLKGRGTESPGDLEIRLTTARSEVDQLSSFDYVVMSYKDRINSVVDDIETIIRATKMRVTQLKYSL